MQIKTFKPMDHKVKALIYGPSGAGKTVFAGSAKNALIASAEGGLLSIADKAPNFVDIKSLKDLKDLHAYLSKEKHEFETVIIDSISEINEIIKLEIEERTGKSMQLQDWGTLSKMIRDIFRKFRDLPMHVVLIAQEQNEKDEDRISKTVPSLNGKAATDVAYFMDICGYIHVENDGRRWIETGSNRRLATKDRSQKIGNDCPIDFEEWKKRVAEIETGEQEVKVEYSAPQEQVAQSGVNYIHNLKAELFQRGAKDEASAIKLLNKSIDTKINSFAEVSPGVASKALIKLLQVPAAPDKKQPQEAVKLTA